MKVIVPCCGRSSRFPNQPPKWMLPGHDGRPMVVMAVAGLRMHLEDLIITILAEHESAFDVTAGLHKAFGHPVRTVVLDRPTRSQPETVAQTLRATALSEPFLVKDSDNTYVLDEVMQDYNYVCTETLNHFDLINPRNKSYVQVDHRGSIVNIREKEVISDQFSVGGYYFVDPTQFLEHLERLLVSEKPWTREIYTSDVISAMILDSDIPFTARPVTGLEDWGTLDDWRRSQLRRQTYFVLLDGFLFERGSQYFRPRFDDVRPIQEAVTAVNDLSRRGHSIVYLSIRPASDAALTEAQIAKAELPKASVLYNCPISSWRLVTSPQFRDFAGGASAVEVEPSDTDIPHQVARST